MCRHVRLVTIYIFANHALLAFSIIKFASAHVPQARSTTPHKTSAFFVQTTASHVLVPLRTAHPVSVDISSTQLITHVELHVPQLTMLTPTRNLVKTAYRHV